jgi:hypothetical protein
MGRLVLVTALLLLSSVLKVRWMHNKLHNKLNDRLACTALKAPCMVLKVHNKQDKRNELPRGRQTYTVKWVLGSVHKALH